MANENHTLSSALPAQSSRRTFLKASGLAAAAATLPAAPATAAPATHAEKASAKTGPIANPVDYVNLLQGADSSPYFSHGGTLPIATTPFGMAHWTLQSSGETAQWFFEPRVRRVQGFRCTHQLSTWLGDYGQATFLPVLGKVKPAPGSWASSFIPEQAKLTPYSLELFLQRYRANVELVPTTRCCIVSATYDAPDPAAKDQVPGFAIDAPSIRGEIKPGDDKKRLQFAVDYTSGGTPDNFACYYVVEFSEAWESFDASAGKSDDAQRHPQAALVYFPAGLHIEARIGTSFISFEQAEYNLQQEIGSKTLAEVKQTAKDEWNTTLRRIEIDGASEKQAWTFYSCMYRTLLFPRTFHEPVPNGTGVHHYSAFNGKLEPGFMYADHGYWDVYRAWYPFMTILFPEKLDEILQAWVNAYKEGGWFPQFPAPGYRACMSGSLIDSLFADSIVKGIGTFDKETVFEGLKKHATQVGDPDKGYGRVGVDLYQQLHYVPADKIDQTVAETADAAYGDFCIAQVAKVLGKQDEYERFMARSEYWKNIYDTSIGFFRGKNSDGSWVEFDQFAWGSPYEEGGAWQHRWDAPHAIDMPSGGLIEAIGGKAKAGEALTQMVTMPPTFHVGVYGSEIHEMSEMAAVPFGQYAHSNQPSHHLLYIFPYAGKPEMLQEWARKTMNELYSPEGFPGDEDTGSMAAWYVLSSLGFYQLAPAKPEYTFGSPLFPRATVHLPGGKTLRIEAAGNTEETVYVHGITFNGAKRTRPSISHKELTAGGTLAFAVSANKPA